jgi:hypothetical protein
MRSVFARKPLFALLVEMQPANRAHKKHNKSTHMTSAETLIKLTSAHTLSHIL